MGVIKSNNAAQPATQVVKLSLRDIEAEAQAHIDRANREAERILAEAQRQASEVENEVRTTIREEGFRQGHAEGVEQGRADVLSAHEEEIRLAVASLSEAAAAIEASRNALEHQALDD